MELLFEVKDLDTGYNNVQVLNAVSLNVNKGEIVALIGSNGTGKSTFVKTVIGWLKPWHGKISFKGRDVSNLPPNQIVRLGIAICPEGRRVFPELTVMENLKMGAYIRKDKGQEEDLAKAFKLFPRLEERKSQASGCLSGGEQQMLALARALMAKPELLLIDELSLGVAPIVIESMIEIVKEIRDLGVAILMIEQNAELALGIADRGYVMETGSIVLQGTGSELLNNENVRKAYLGI
jgi:branched-chain amino acid transport system ATP-binding protein